MSRACTQNAYRIVAFVAMAVIAGPTDARTPAPARGSVVWAGADKGARDVFRRFIRATNEQDLNGLLDDRSSAEYAGPLIFWLYVCLHRDFDGPKTLGVAIPHRQTARDFVLLLKRYGIHASDIAIGNYIKRVPSAFAVQHGRRLYCELCRLGLQVATEDKSTHENEVKSPYHVLELNLERPISTINPGRMTYRVLSPFRVKITGASVGQLGSTFHAIKKHGVWQLSIDSFAGRHRQPLM